MHFCFKLPELRFELIDDINMRPSPFYNSHVHTAERASIVDADRCRPETKCFLEFRLSNKVETSNKAMRNLPVLLIALFFHQSRAFGVPRIRLSWKSSPENKTFRESQQDPYDDGRDHTLEEESNTSPDETRRMVWKQLLVAGSVVAATPGASWAGEVGARITKAVTTSDLGISVRTSVVKGAQVMDQLDGKWEKFSDKFGLGSERSKQGSRPQPKVIPDPLPLNVPTAKSVLDASDRVFCAVSGISPADLQSRIEKVANLVKISFERSGVAFPESGSILKFETAPQFNFVVYSHFKAFSELIVARNIAFGPFRSEFEKQLGQQLVSQIQTAKWKDISKSTEKGTRLQVALAAVDEFLSAWRQNGLVALTERSSVDEDLIADWLEDIADVEFTVALDGDITLNSQVLLQEQGFRLYPNFCRYVVTYLMEQVSPSDQKVSAMDYYFDTDYSSDPDKFEVKEVLLSVQLETI